jgi:hypothetical protein
MISFLLILSLVGQTSGVVTAIEGHHEQRNSVNQVSASQSPIPSIQSVSEQPKASNTGSDTSNPQQITIVDMRSRALEWGALIFNFLLLLVVGYQAYTYKQQLGAMREGLRQNEWAFRATQRHASATLSQMQVQAEAARDAAIIAKDTLRISQRAYVGLEREPRLSLQSNGNPEIEVYFVNTGRTPAHVVEFRYKFSSDAGAKEYRGVKKDFFIFAGTPKRIQCVWNHQSMDDEWLQQIEDRESKIFFAGRLAYEGVWGVHDFGDEVIRFKYFSISTNEMREAYAGDKDYDEPDFIVELDGTEEITSEPPWGPEEPPDYEPYDPFDI